MIEIIQTYKATVCFTAPTAYRVMLRAMDEGADLSSCARRSRQVKPCPHRSMRNGWQRRASRCWTGSAPPKCCISSSPTGFEDHKPACTGKPVTGYEAKVVAPMDGTGSGGRVGRLAVRGPTGCRYLRMNGRRKYVIDGWNITGDSFSMSEDGYLHFAARNDDMIISGGYNIAGPEVEAALLAHDAVAGMRRHRRADEARGAIVEAHVVLNEGNEPSRAKTCARRCRTMSRRSSRRINIRARSCLPTHCRRRRPARFKGSGCGRRRKPTQETPLPRGHAARDQT
jgi:2-aminobenzoate-CoA ligase